jgi:sialic acid synthase
MYIAEVGQNHQGDIEMAKKYVEIFSRHGASVIKFQTRNNKHLFSKGAYTNKYNSENSFAETYGEHREELELSPDDLRVLKRECIKHSVKFMSTPFDEPSLDLICDIGVDLIKVSSFDIGNIPFLNKVSKKGLPVVLSTGGGDLDVVKSSIKELSLGIDDITILHCVSEYPCPAERLGLEVIKEFKEIFPNFTIGLSDHFNGILSGPIAYMMGARVFEKHVTMNRSWKGTDHAFALEPHGFGNFVRDIERTSKMIRRKPSDELGKEEVFNKLGKSIIAAKDLYSGMVISKEDLSGRIFSCEHTPVRESINFIGSIVKNNKKKGSPITYDDIT